MAKLYFKYGAMGSSKTAQALITKYNYEENDLNVWLIKPGTDTRDGAKILRSRIGPRRTSSPPARTFTCCFRTRRRASATSLSWMNASS